MASSNKPRTVGPVTTIAAITVGNALEFFDFTVFGFLGLVIGKLFFPHASSYGQFLLSAATFGVGFVVRPIGGVLIGAYADRVGRKPAMTLSIMLMTAGCAVLAFSPTYAQIGVLAPVLVVVARMLQGLSAGGEVGPSTTMLIEHGRSDNRCYVTSWVLASQGMGVLFGAAVVSGLTTWLSPEAMETWGWRVPFALGLVIAPVGFYIRQHLHESLDMSKQSQVRADSRRKGKVSTLISAHPRILLGGILSGLGSTAATQVVTFYMPSYAIRELNLPASLSLASAVLIGAIFVICSPPVGRWADRAGRRPLVFAFRVMLVAALFPLFVWLLAAPGITRLLVVVALLSVLLVGQSVPGITLFAESLPKDVRSTGIALSYSVFIVLGGLSPLITTWLVHLIGPLAPAWYLSAVTLLSLYGLRLLDDKTGRVLDADPVSSEVAPPGRNDASVRPSIHS